MQGANQSGDDTGVLTMSVGGGGVVTEAVVALVFLSLCVGLLVASLSLRVRVEEEVKTP